MLSLARRAARAAFTRGPASAFRTALRYYRQDRPEIVIAENQGLRFYTVARDMIGEKVRNLREHGFEEGVSTRLLIYAGQLVARGIEPRRAAQVAIVSAISDDLTVQEAVADIVDVILP